MPDESMNAYEIVRAARSAQLNRRIAVHEIGHAYVAKALGSIVEFVTIVPSGGFSGRCVRRGAPSTSLAFADDREPEAAEVSPASEAEPPEPPTVETAEIVNLCAGIGAPKIGSRRIEFAEETARATVMMIELVAARVCEKIFYPDLDPMDAEHDQARARAFALVICSSPAAVEAMLRFGEAEAEALIRAHMGAVSALVDALVEHGMLLGTEVDKVISDAMATEAVAAERKRREQWQRRVDSATKFQNSIAGK